MNQSSEPFQQLLDIASRSQSAAAGLPAQLKVQPHWSGIGFASGGHRMVAPMGQVIEILAVPSCTRLPRVKPWVRGVANVRGRLLPLVDLEAFWGGSLSSNRRGHRVLVLEVDERYCGVIVDEVFGIKHFPVDTYVHDTPDIGAERERFVGGAYVSHDGQWALFRADRLMHDPDFMDTAI